MRTTLTIDDEILTAARSIASETGKTIGEVISELARKGLKPDPQRRTRRGVPVFSVSERARPFTPEAVRRGLDDEE